MKDETKLAKQLWALGDPVRLRILQLLPLSADCGHNNNVSQLAEKLGLSQPAVSHHLRVLRQAGLVENEKMCRDVFYWIDHPGASRVVKELSVFLKTSPAPAKQSKLSKEEARI